MINVSDEACLQMINALEYITTLQELELSIKCSECLLNKINSRISIINGKRHLSNKCLPILSCYDNEHKITSRIYIKLCNSNMSGIN